MNNNQLIADAALKTGFYSQLEVAEYLDQGFPCHSISTWKKIGKKKGIIYNIRDGEKGLECNIWKSKKSKDGENAFYKTKCIFYKENQLSTEKAEDSPLDM